MTLCFFLLAGLVPSVLSSFQATAKIRTADGDLHLQGNAVIVDMPGVSFNLQDALNDVSTEVRSVERRQAQLNQSIQSVVTAFSASSSSRSQMLADAIQNASDHQIATLVATSRNQTVALTAMAAASETAASASTTGASFVHATPGTVYTGDTVTVWGRDFIPNAPGLYQCSFLSVHNGQTMRTAAVAAVNSTAITCPAPSYRGPAGTCAATMMLNVEEAGTRLAHPSSAGFNITGGNNVPAFDRELPDIAVARGGVAPSVASFTVIAADSSGGTLRSTVTSSNQAVISQAQITLQPASNGRSHTLSLVTNNVRDARTTITVRIQNDCGASQQSFIVSVRGISHLAPNYRVSSNSGNFTNHNAVDLSNEGLELCYAWLNNGAQAPTYDYLREACGQYKRILMGGWRCGSARNPGNLIRFPITFTQNRRFLDVLPVTMPTSTRDFGVIDTAGRYSWYLSRPWYLLTRANNGWRDPGRLWEPSARAGRGGGWTHRTAQADMGHVLSQNGNQGHDQHSCHGEVYVVYGDPTTV